MERFEEIFKKHPWWIVGGILIVVALIYLMTRTSSSSAGGIVSYGPSDAVVQANTAYQIALAQANAGTAQAQLANEKSANDNEAAIAINAQNTSTALAAINSNNAAATTINSQNVAGAENINASNNATAISLGNIAQTVALGQQSTDVQLHEIDANNAMQASILNMLGQTNPKGGMASYVDATTGQLTTIGLNNRNPFGMKQ